MAATEADERESSRRHELELAGAEPRAGCPLWTLARRASEGKRLPESDRRRLLFEDVAPSRHGAATLPLSTSAGVNTLIAGKRTKSDLLNVRRSVRPWRRIAATRRASCAPLPFTSFLATSSRQ